LCRIARQTSTALRVGLDTMPAVRASNPSRLGSLRPAGIVVLCAIAALVVSMATPNRADAARVRCAGTFRVLHDDHVGALSLPRGDYRISILASGRPTCAQAAALFTRFLEDFDGRLPGGWRVGAASSTFLRSAGVGFHVARTSGEGGGGSGEEEESGGSGTDPLSSSFCPGTFRVLNNDHIGPLHIARGPYWIVLLQHRGITCSQASKLFARFLASVSGNLPPPWLLESQTASFFRSAGGAGFRIKPAG
jgi:hypothetical protein